VSGYGDIAAAGLTITASRDEKVDFTSPYLGDISELLVTHVDTPAARDISDLSGKEIFVRKSSSYFSSILSVNDDLIRNGKPPIKIVECRSNLPRLPILMWASTVSTPSMTTSMPRLNIFILFDPDTSAMLRSSPGIGFGFP
jgi:membrane-bound lytic murein transglycosylase MltF